MHTHLLYIHMYFVAFQCNNLPKHSTITESFIKELNLYVLLQYVFLSDELFQSKLYHSKFSFMRFIIYTASPL